MTDIEKIKQEVSEVTHEFDRKVAMKVIDYLSEHGYITEEWKPIDTAPKDGTRVIVYRPKGEYKMKLRVLTKEELFDLFKQREKARVRYERFCLSEISPTASAEEKFEAEFGFAAAKREYETISREYQLAQDNYLNGE